MNEGHFGIPTPFKNCQKSSESLFRVVKMSFVCLKNLTIFNDLIVEGTTYFPRTTVYSFSVPQIYTNPDQVIGIYNHTEHNSYPQKYI